MADLSEQDEIDLEEMDRAFGLCVGQLNEREMKAFNRLCASGLARRSYNTPLALFGLAIAERDFPSTQSE